MSLDREDFKYGIQVLIAEKPLDKSINKAVEELAELSVKLLHYINKPNSIKVDDIEEEIADCLMHFEVLQHYFPVSDSLLNTKIDKFLNSEDFKTYKEKYEYRDKQI